MSLEKYFNEIGIAIISPTIDIGVAHLRKSIKVKSALKAIKTPTGFPTTVARLPRFVANTIIIINGIGLTRNFEVRCNIVVAIKSIDVTSSTSEQTFQT